jgi:hypothetical protein
MFNLITMVNIDNHQASDLVLQEQAQADSYYIRVAINGTNIICFSFPDCPWKIL